MEKSEIETIYRKYFHDVFLYIRALSENESLAEEITQETFLKAMNNIEKFDGCSCRFGLSAPPFFRFSLILSRKHSAVIATAAAKETTATST